MRYHQHHDLTDHHALDYVRRSVAMLSPGANALKREDALIILDQLIDLLREQELSR